jgi:hypothetical protein
MVRIVAQGCAELETFRKGTSEKTTHGRRIRKQQTLNSGASSGKFMPHLMLINISISAAEILLNTYHQYDNSAAAEIEILTHVINMNIILQPTCL